MKKDKKEGDFFAFLNMIQPGDTVLDIGANIGIMTYYLSRKVGGGKVFSFEPVPENIATLKKIIEKFDLNNVQLVTKALGDKPGKLEMVMPQFGKARKQGLSHVVHDSITEFNEGKKYEVDVLTLDDYFKNKEVQVSAIKLDVENFEYFVLKGGAQCLQKWRPIIYTELWENENRTLCMDLLSSWDYKVKVVVNEQLLDWDSEIHNHQNFIFMPLGRDCDYKISLVF